MKNNIHIYEIKYSDKEVARGAEALVADDLGAVYFEYPTIRAFVEKTEISDNDYYSFLSPKFEEKSRVRVESIRDLVNINEDVDVFIINPFQYKSYLYKSIMDEFGATHGKYLSSEIRKIIEIDFVGIDLDKRVPPKAWSYCNYWVMRGWVLRLFQAKANLIIEKIIELENSFNILRPNYKKVKSSVPFVYERLLTLFLVSQNNIKYKNVSENITSKIVTYNEALILKLIDESMNSIYEDIYFGDALYGLFNKANGVNINDIYWLDKIERNHREMVSDELTNEKFIYDFLCECEAGSFFENIELENLDTYQALNGWLDSMICKFGSENKKLFYFIHYNLRLNGYARVESHERGHDFLNKINKKFSEKYKDTVYCNIEFTDLLCAQMFTNVQEAFNLNRETDIQQFKAWLKENKESQFYNGVLRAVKPIHNRIKDRIDIYCFSAHAGGIGKDARLISNALMAIKRFDVNLINIADPNFAVDEAGDVAFFIAPAQEIAKFLFKDPKLMAYYQHKYAFMQWELAKWPAELQEIPKLFDLVLVSSDFTKKSFSEYVETRKITMPSYVVSAGVKRSETKIRFLTMYDSWSYIERKNPYAAIKAFQALDSDYPIELVVKVANINKAEHEKLLKIEADDGRISIITNSMTDAEVYELIESSHALLSFQRSEGFGRVLLEALCLGTYVFSNDYSGVSEFSKSPNFINCKYTLIPVENNYPYGKDQYWADIDEEDLLSKLNVFCKQFVAKEINFSIDEKLVNKYTVENCAKDMLNLMEFKR